MTYQAERGGLAAWYSHIDTAAQLDEYRDVLDSSTRKRVRKTLDKSRARDSLQPARRVLFDRFEYVLTARKVVGVGSVGTGAWIILLRGPGGDPLFLQVKEAQPSVLAEYLDGPAFTNQGERVVTGQRLMQVAGDILLGWRSASSKL